MKLRNLLFLLFMSAFVQAQTVVDIVVNSPDHTILETAVIEADLAGALSGDGPFTLFAPTDDAFNALPAGTVEALLEDPSGALTDILLYHAVGAEAFSTDLSDGQVITTLNGKDITVTINSDGVFINDAQVTMADIDADNGVVHVLNAVLLPPSNTVVDIVVNSEDHNTLEAAVIAANLAEALSGDGPFTLFAPTDNAFDALPAGTVEALLADPSGALTDILQYHVVGAEAFSTDLSDGQVITTLNGDDIIVTINTDGVFINDAQVTIADIPADNGVVHVIDAVLLPPTTVVDVIVNSPVHNTLEAAVIAADLAETLSGEGPFTVFAPTDDAFNALPAGTVEALLADPSGALTDILLYHVVGAEALSTDLSDGQVITTLNGDDITVTINTDGVFINDAQVTIADIPADNGVVHVLNAVLLPPTNTVVDIIVNSPVHNTLEAAVIAANLAEALSGEGPFTVFAPTDAAFDALPEGTLDALLADPSGQLTTILLYHVVGGTALSTDLSDGQVIETALGRDITVTINSDGVFINDAQVTIADIPADNGVVHVIDAVLLPPAPSIYDIVQESPDHTTLKALLDASELEEALSTGNDLTLFAPTDEAFSVLPDDIINALLADETGQREFILNYHLTTSLILAGDLTDGTIATSANGLDYLVTLNADGDFVINANGGPGAKITVTDIITTNGVVHVLDAILLPNTTSSVVFNSQGFSILSTLLQNTGLINTLDDVDTRFTVFAPTDAAFAAVPEDILLSLVESPEKLTDVLLYHAVPGRTFAGDLSDGLVITTAQGETATVTIDASGGVFINDAQIIQTDFFTGNGLIHVIDAVLLPAPTTVMDVVIRSDVHNTLQLALDTAQLSETLQGEGTFTLFAPTDAAFGNLPAGTVEALLEDPTGALQQILLYHALDSEVLSTDLSDGLTATTLNGADITVTIVDGNVFINDAQVIIADIQTDNGIVHVLDAVLLPPTNTVEIAASEANIYPNPATDVITVDYNESQLDNPTIYIMDNAGKVIRNVRNLSSGSTIDVSQLQNGVYNFIISDGKNTVTKRVTKIQ